MATDGFRVYFKQAEMLPDCVGRCLHTSVNTLKTILCGEMVQGAQLGLSKAVVVKKKKKNEPGQGRAEQVGGAHGNISTAQSALWGTTLALLLRGEPQ